MTDTEVTIEDLAGGQPAAKTTSVQAAPVISDLGQITFDAPSNFDENTAKKPKVVQKKYIPLPDLPASASQDRDEIFDPVSGQKIATTPESDEGELHFSLQDSQRLLAAESQRLSAFPANPLDKDDFGPALTAILELLTAPTAEFDAVVASLDPIFADIDDKSIRDLERELRDLVVQAQTARTRLVRQVDALLASFPSGNNWYRLLAAWQVFDTPAFRPLVEEKNWLAPLQTLSLSLLTGAQKAEISADVAAGISLDDSLQNLIHELEQGGVTLSTAQQAVFLAHLTPILQEYIDNFGGNTAKKSQVVQKKFTKTTPSASTSASQPATPAASATAPVSAPDFTTSPAWTTLQSKLEAFIPRLDKLEDRLQSSDEHASRLEKIEQRLSESDQRASRLEEMATTGLRQLGEQSAQGLSKIASQLDEKFARERQAATDRHQQLEERLDKAQQDLQHKITALDEAVGSFKKLQATKDQDHNKKVNDLNKIIESINKNSSEQNQKSGQDLAQIRQEVEERVGQLARQLADIKTDQIRVDQIQTNALSQLTSSTQTLRTELTGLGERLGKLEAGGGELEALKASLEEQVQTLASRVSADLDASRQRLEKIGEQVAQLQAYASRLETENEELRIANAGLKQENWQARRQLGDSPEPPVAGAPATTAPTPATEPVAAPATPPAATPAPVAQPPLTPATPSTPIPSEQPAAPVIESAPAASTPAVTPAATPVTAPIYESTPAAPAPSNREKLGLTTRRLTPDSRLLTHAPLDFLGLNRQLITALTGVNSFSDWLRRQRTVHNHAQLPDAVPTPVPDYRAVIPDAPAFPVELPTPPRVDAIPPTAPVDIAPAGQSATATSPLLQVDGDFAAAGSEETVVLPFMG